MDQRKMKEAKLAELKASLLTVEGRPTEVYSRIVGYYRSVRNWNAGKREEFSRRREYAFPSYAAPAEKIGRGEHAAAPARPRVDASRAASYLLFTRRACPNCPPVREWLASSKMDGHNVDVDFQDGLELARQYGVLATPTAILLDGAGDELDRCYTRAQLIAAMSPATLAAPALLAIATTALA